MKTWFAAVAALITFGLALTACGSSAHPAPRSAGRTQDPSGRSGLEAVVQCLRAHGVPDFPDPLPDGVFALPPPLMHKGDPVGEHADAACQKYLPSGHYSVIPASS